MGVNDEPKKKNKKDDLFGGVLEDSILIINERIKELEEGRENRTKAANAKSDAIRIAAMIRIYRTIVKDDSEDA